MRCEEPCEAEAQLRTARPRLEREERRERANGGRQDGGGPDSVAVPPPQARGTTWWWSSMACVSAATPTRSHRASGPRRLVAAARPAAWFVTRRPQGPSDALAQARCGRMKARGAPSELRAPRPQLGRRLGPAHAHPPRRPGPPRSTCFSSGLFGLKVLRRAWHPQAGLLRLQDCQCGRRRRRRRRRAPAEGV